METYRKLVKLTDANIPSIDTRIFLKKHASLKCCGGCVGLYPIESDGEKLFSATRLAASCWAGYGEGRHREVTTKV